MFILAQLPPYSWPWPCWHSMAMQQAHAYINSLLPGVNNTVPIHATRDKFSKTKMMHLWINLHIPRHILVKWSHTTGFSTFLILILYQYRQLYHQTYTLCSQDAWKLVWVLICYRLSRLLSPSIILISMLTTYEQFGCQCPPTVYSWYTASWNKP